jgi:hypothetical protein
VLHQGQHAERRRDVKEAPRVVRGPHGRDLDGLAAQQRGQLVVGRVQALAEQLPVGRLPLPCRRGLENLGDLVELHDEPGLARRRRRAHPRRQLADALADRLAHLFPHPRRIDRLQQREEIVGEGLAVGEGSVGHVRGPLLSFLSWRLARGLEQRRAAGSRGGEQG